MDSDEFDFQLPQELIAQHPPQLRDSSRLLAVNSLERKIDDDQFENFPTYLKFGDVLVLNDSRVIPARLRGQSAKTGGAFELLLTTENALNDWWAMIRPGKRAKLGTEIILLDAEKKPTSLRATVTEINAEGHRRLEFIGTKNIFHELDRLGEIPLPPYIERTSPEAEDKLRYQTVYARAAGSVAAPTAGLHFTNAILEQIKSLGVTVCYVTLHVGIGTFAPVKVERVSEHVMHAERFSLNDETAAIINTAKADKRRIVAVGTTTVRVLESVAQRNAGVLKAENSSTSIFIYPPFQFQIVDALLTNFHLPRSTLLMLVSAFAQFKAGPQSDGRKIILSAYAHAICERYRFFSYGDAMVLS